MTTGGEGEGGGTTAAGDNRPAPAAARGTMDPTHTSMLYRVGRLICRFYVWLFHDLKVYGTENLPATGGVLIVANHQSYLDPILVGVKLPRPVSYMAKSELFENKFFAWLIRNLYAFPVKQGAGDVGAVREAVARLKEGHVLNIFPEGSRTEDGELLPIQSGVALIVRKAGGIPIVPFVIDGSFRAWPKGQKLPHPTPIKAMFGPPLNVEGLKGEAIVKLIDQTFRQMLGDLKEIH